MDFSLFDRRPLVIALAGSNGAGKSSFYHAHLAGSGLRFVNADILAAEMAMDPYAATRLADALRRELVRQGESFIFETVFSDPVGDKVGYLEDASRCGCTVVLCFIGLASPEQSIERVAMRVSQGGHDVADEKLLARFPRTLHNLQSAIARLPHILVFDNSDLSQPYRLAATFMNAELTEVRNPIPDWLRPMLP